MPIGFVYIPGFDKRYIIDKNGITKDKQTD